MTPSVDTQRDAIQEQGHRTLWYVRSINDELHVAYEQWSRSPTHSENIVIIQNTFITLLTLATRRHTHEVHMRGLLENSEP